MVVSWVSDEISWILYGTVIVGSLIFSVTYNDILNLFYKEITEYLLYVEETTWFCLVRKTKYYFFFSYYIWRRDRSCLSFFNLNVLLSSIIVIHNGMEIKETMITEKNLEKEYIWCYVNLVGIIRKYFFNVRNFVDVYIKFI